MLHGSWYVHDASACFNLLLLPWSASGEGRHKSEQGRSPQTSVGNWPSSAVFLAAYIVWSFLWSLSKIQQLSSYVLLYFFIENKCPMPSPIYGSSTEGWGLPQFLHFLQGQSSWISAGRPSHHVHGSRYQNAVVSSHTVRSPRMKGSMLAILFGTVTIFLAANMPCQVSSSFVTWPKQQLPGNRARVLSLEEFISTKTFTWSERLRLYPICVDLRSLSNSCANFKSLVNDPFNWATCYTNVYSTCNVQAIRVRCVTPPIWIQWSSRKVVEHIFDR